jgi:hypothetical protein
MNKALDVVPTDLNSLSDETSPDEALGTRTPKWEQAEGSPLPLGDTWIEQEQAFNFAVHAEHAESVTLLLYSATDLVNPCSNSAWIFCAASQDGSGTAEFRGAR